MLLSDILLMDIRYNVNKAFIDNTLYNSLFYVQLMFICKYMCMCFVGHVMIYTVVCHSSQRQLLAPLALSSLLLCSLVCTVHIEASMYQVYQYGHIDSL